MSCRRGVPDRCSYLNSLAEKVRELWERCANAIKSINGINPDGANNFDILPGAGIQVNPRANGIEIVATGAAPEGMIETINSEGPDSDGNFTMTAGSGIQINAGTNGLEIENTSQGAIYTGVSPITINADNEISLDEWEEDGGSAWNLYIDADNKTVEDLLLIVNNSLINDDIYIPKGSDISKLPFNPIWAPSTSSIRLANLQPSAFYNFVFSQTNSMPVTGATITLITATSYQSSVLETVTGGTSSLTASIIKSGTNKNIFLYRRRSNA